MLVVGPGRLKHWLQDIADLGGFRLRFVPASATATPLKWWAARVALCVVLTEAA